MTYTENPALQSHFKLLVNRIIVGDQHINSSSSEVKKVTVSYQDRKHDQAVVTTKLTKSQAEEFLDRTISFTFGPVTNRRSFQGYVSVVVPSRSYQEDLVYDLVCLGVTKVMQTGKPRFYRDETAPQVAGKIVTEHRLGFHSPYHQFKWPSIAQTDGSDWELITNLAQVCGFSLFTVDGVVRFVDPDAALRKSGPYLHLIKGDQALDKSRQLLDFFPRDHSDSLKKNIVPSFGYFDAGMNAAVTEEPGSEKYRLSTSFPIFGKDMALTIQGGWKRSAEFWNQVAAARIQGNAGLTPGVTVNIQLGTSKVIDNDYDGVWFVRGVDHVLTHNSFQTNLTLARNKRRTAPTNTDYRTFYDSIGRRKPSLSVDGSDEAPYWKSSWLQPVIDAPSAGVAPEVSTLLKGWFPS